MNAPPTVKLLSASEMADNLPALARLIVACVEDGASIGFILPFTERMAHDFWQQMVLPGVTDGSRKLLVARRNNIIVGTVQLGLGTPANQPHRADVSKLLVSPDCRRSGIATALMKQLENLAINENRRLLTLDTRTGDSAEPLYTALGYQTVGIIPNFCLDVAGERFDGTTVMFKQLPT